MGKEFVKRFPQPSKRIVGPWLHTNGYMVMKIRRKFELEHRYIAALALGRELEPGEVVDHINGIRADNRPENLRVCTQSENMQNARHCPTCKCLGP